VLISTDVGFLDKVLAITLLLKLPADDKACGTYPATFHFKALVSEVSHNWNVWVHSFPLRKKTLTVHQANGWRDETHFL